MTCFRFHCPVARRPHCCDYCGEEIPVGQRYQRWCCVQDGRASTVSAHLACDAVARAAWDESDCYDEERWVCWDTLGEWAAGRSTVAADLAAMGAHWPPGEVERLTALLAPVAAGRTEP